LPELIEAAARAGQFTTTQAALTRLQTLGNGAHSDRGLGLVALATALISAGPVAAEEFERSIDHLQRTRVAIMLARAHLLYGEWRRRARQRAAAQQELTLAHETFEAIGAGHSWSGPAVDCGAANQPARTTPDNEHLLTSRELTIAQLAAARQLNRVIAQRLFISEKTVEYHLGKGVHQAQGAVANPAHVQTPRRANGHAARSPQPSDVNRNRRSLA
jgi:DNA-binding CsgD family transcriptional regulator